ncbi:hypothetical protein CS8_022700 [Cupriavidus sp. 8B]
MTTNAGGDRHPAEGVCAHHRSMTLADKWQSREGIGSMQCKLGESGLPGYTYRTTVRSTKLDWICPLSPDTVTPLRL